MFHSLIVKSKRRDVIFGSGIKWNFQKNIQQLLTVILLSQQSLSTHNHIALMKLVCSLDIAVPAYFMWQNDMWSLFENTVVFVTVFQHLSIMHCPSFRRHGTCEFKTQKRLFLQFTYMAKTAFVHQQDKEGTLSHIAPYNYKIRSKVTSRAKIQS